MYHLSFLCFLLWDACAFDIMCDYFAKRGNNRGWKLCWLLCSFPCYVWFALDVLLLYQRSDWYPKRRGMKRNTATRCAFEFSVNLIDGLFNFYLRRIDPCIVCVIHPKPRVGVGLKERRQAFSFLFEVGKTCADLFQHLAPIVHTSHYLWESRCVYSVYEYVGAYTVYTRMFVRG